ncbi:hypothetical protein LGN17_35410 [Burkholderia sp. AU30280]|nr:RHS repeat-associated core domain-containing protein [Burkholderia sp. AU30280]MCA8277776.1 hypothetical protein [Burkholderia sp. AU30280]
MHSNQHRYYDPQSSRFVSKDRIGLAGGLNPFQYAPNPIEWVTRSVSPSGVRKPEVVARTTK